MLHSDLLTPTDGDFDRFEERLFHTIAVTQAQRMHRHRAVIAASAALLLAGGGATAWVTLATPELQDTSAYCYAAADTGSAFTQVGSPSDQMADDGTVSPVSAPADPVDAALSNCAAVWAIDFFGPPGSESTARNTAGSTEAGTNDTGTNDTGTNDTGTNGTGVGVPELQACLRPDGVISVFPVPPGDGNVDDPDAFCAVVGLQPPYRP